MAIPKTVLFDLCDWNARFASTADLDDLSIVDQASSLAASALLEHAAALDGVLWFGADAVKAAGPVVRRAQGLLTDVVVPSSFTLEFDLLLTDELPTTFENPNNRLFVGAINQQGATAGLLFSWQGIALATQPDDPNPTKLGGSAGLLVDSKGALHPSLTVRVCVDAAAGFMTIQTAPTADAYSQTGGGPAWAEHAELQLRYTQQLRPTTMKVGDGVLVWGTASSAAILKGLDPAYVGDGQAVTFGIASLRLASTALPITPRPVATISAAAQGMVGRPIVLRGDESYDPVGNVLTFAWELESAPQHSAAVLEGASDAILLIGNDLVVRYRYPTSTASDFVVTLASQADQTGKLHVSFVSGTMTILLEMMFDNLGVLVPKTTAADVAAAFASSFSPAYCPDVAELFAVSPGTSGGLVPLTPGTYLFSSGTVGKGSDLHNPTFTPDLPGLYRFSLRVGSGTRLSLKTTHTLLAAITEQLTGHRPNADYIFHHLSDFWNLVPDRAQLSTVWSSVMQTVAAEMTAALQNDHYKALRDISRRYQRRWLNYDTVVRVVQDAALVRPKLTGLLGLVPQSPTKGVATGQVQLSQQFPAPPVEKGTRVLQRNSVMRPNIVEITKVGNVPGSLLDWKVYAAGEEFVHYRSVGKGVGQFVVDPAFPNVPTSLLLHSQTYPTSSFDPQHDAIRLTIGGTMVVVQVVAVDPLKGPPGQLAHMANTLELLLANQPIPQPFSLPVQPVNGQTIEWEHLQVAYGNYLAVYPHFLYPAATDLTELGLELGDSAEVTVTDPQTGVVMPVLLPIVAVDARSVFVQWSTLFALMGAVSSEKPQWGYDDLPDWLTRLTGFRRSGRIPGHSDLVSVPFVGSTLRATLFENTDYQVVSGDLQLQDWLSCAVSTTAGSEEVVVTAGHQHVNFPSDTTLDALKSVDATTLLVLEGDGGSYRILSRPAVNKFVLDRPMLMSGRFPARLPRAHYAAPLPDTLWAEVSHFDNSQMVEDRFGLYVGVSKKLFDQYVPTADYLTTVRTLWFCFLHGPTLANLQLPIQAMLSLPCTEADGQIVQVVPPSVERDGVITLVSTTGVTYTYTYPNGVELGVNPRTGRQFRPAPVDLEPQNQAETDALADSRVEQFTRLVEVVMVDDYISNPRKLARELQGQEAARRYHTFMVDVPLHKVGTTKSFPLIRQFLNEAKANHTNYILVGSITLSDDVDVEDVLQIDATVMLHDSIASAPYTAPKLAVGPQGQAVIALAVENQLWPTEGVDAAFPGGSFPTKQLLTTQPQLGEVKERYEAGYVEGVLDNYSGDGSHNQHLKWVDQVNRLDVGGIDVCRSFMWVPCEIDSGSFVVGESVTIGDGSNGNAELATIWASSPPVVEYVGAGHNPYLPGVEDPQADHPLTYLILGFQQIPPTATLDPAVIQTGLLDYTAPGQADWAAVVDLGTEARLDALKAGKLLVGDDVSKLRLVGLTSGAIASGLIALDHADSFYDNYYMLERMIRADKILDYGPKDVLDITVLRYIPLLGETLTSFKASDNMVVATNALYRRGVQQYPYQDIQFVPEAEQFAPSVGPGLFLATDLSNFPVGGDNADGNPQTDANVRVRWGYKDLGVINQPNPHALSTFRFDETAPFLKNVHIGLTLRSQKWWQYSQGFTRFQVPAPAVKRALSLVGGPNPAPGVVRLEGYGFTAPDTTDTGGGGVHDQLDGQVGGSWVFFRETGTLPLLPALVVDFLTGNSTDELWGQNGEFQLEGHALVVTPPIVVTPDGTLYDVVVRQYRRFQTDGGVPHEDTMELESLAVKVGGNWTVSYGANPYESKADNPPASYLDAISW